MTNLFLKTDMKILITGASGFLGRHLTPRLERGNELLTPTSKQLDVSDYDALQQYFYDHDFDTIIHLAARCGGIGANKNNPAVFFEKNLQMSTNILKLASEFDEIKKMITLGSVCSYPKFTEVPFKEENIWNGYPEETNAPYGIAKRSLMMGCQYYNQQYGDNFVHLIPVNMYGEYDHFDLQNSHVIPALIRKMHEAKVSGASSVTVWGDGSASREFLYAGDCAEAIELALKLYNSPEPVNIGTGQEITIKDLVEKIKNVVEYKGDIVYDTTKPNGQPRRCLDTSKAESKLCFQARTSFDEGLKKTYEWYIKQL